MSLHPQAFCPVPEETVRIARAAYPKGNVYLQARDELGTIYTDQSFAELFPKCGQPAEAPWRFLLVSLMQFAEGLSDRQAADAVRGRLDWKYQLGLELTDPGFDASVLSVHACWEGRQNSRSCSHCSMLPASMDGSKSVESNEQTQPMFLGLCAPSAGWRRWEKRCEQR